MRSQQNTEKRSDRVRARLLRWSIGLAIALVGGLMALLWVDGRRTMPVSPKSAASLEEVDDVSLQKLGSAPPSRCFGTVSDGRLDDGWQLPLRGENFQAYSGIGWQLGRTYVHSTVVEIVLETYASLRLTDPGLQFVYGETGFENGGRFRPHRTHRSGTSVDFVSPVRRKGSGEPAVLPTSAENKWGYGIDFDGNGEWGDYVLDLEAIALHLAVLREVAGSRGVPLAKVVLYPPLRRKLATTGAWHRIADLPFTQNEAWVRHDDHYHVDFGVKCEPVE